MLDFGARPGLYFVWATLLPLASFVFLLLVGAARNFARRYKSESGQAAQCFQMLGGDTPGKFAFYIATGAIAAACLLSVIGFVTYLAEDHHAHEHEIHAEQEQLAKLSQEKNDLPRQKAAVISKYNNSLLKLSALEKQEKAGEKVDVEFQRELVDFFKKELDDFINGTVRNGEKVKSYAEKIDEFDLKIAEVKEHIAHHEHRWSGSVVWAQVLPAFYRDHNPNHGTTLRIGFFIDGLAAIMFVMVTFVATLIHIFSSGYMAEELQKTVEDHEVHTSHGHLHRRGRFGRFYLFLSLFCFSMLNLLVADNLFQVFISWELVGVCSYLLIGFYYERQSASNAANKAFITNRIGDAGFIIGLLIVWTYIGTFNFQEIFARVRAPERAFSAENVSQRVDVHQDYMRKIVHGEITWDVERINPTSGALEPMVKVAKAGEKPTLDSLVFLFPHNLPERGGFLAVGPEAIPSTRENVESHEHYIQTVYRKAQPAVDDYGFMPYWMLVAAGLGIFLGCVGKSAQFPLHVWLPDAMEGPTPVSALIHAATMVAAGVYLVGRCFPLFTGEVLLVIAYTGGITLFVAATIAIVANDIKKVLAYSTVSQLGYMMLGLGVGGWVAGLFHLVTHAFFKALMFLASGSVIYGCHHVQDMNKMGGLYPKMKITALTMLMGVFAIAGVPLFSGWYSKDAVLASAFGFAEAHPEHYLLFILPLLTAGITTFYMFRMWFMTFAGTPKDKHVHDHAHESPWVMTIPLIILAVFAVGVAWGWPLWDAEASWLEHQIHHALPASASVHGYLVDFTNEYHLGHAGHMLAGNLALVAVIIGFTFAALLYYRKAMDPAEATRQFPGVYRFLQSKWYFDELYSAMIVRPALTVSGWCSSFDTRVIDGFVNWLGRVNVVLARATGRFDKGVVDGLVNLVARVSYGIGNSLRGAQTGYLRSYVLFMVLAAVGIWVLLTLFLSSGAQGAP